MIRTMFDKRMFVIQRPVFSTNFVELKITNRANSDLAEL